MCRTLDKLDRSPAYDSIASKNRTACTIYAPYDCLTGGNLARGRSSKSQGSHCTVLYHSTIKLLHIPQADVIRPDRPLQPALTD